MDIKVKYKFYVTIDEFPILKFSFTYYGHWFYRNMNLKTDGDWERYLFWKFDNDDVGCEERNFLETLRYKTDLSIEDIVFVFNRLNLETIIRDLVIDIIETYNKEHQSKITHKKYMLYLKNLTTKNCKTLSITDEVLR